jgi:AbrB family looped-hinge helix DNA binding protein
MSEKGQIEIPQVVREHQGLRSGDDFEVEEAPGKVILSKITPRQNKGLIKHLLACPHPFEIPDRDANDTVGTK